ncbi:MAG TPA: phosphate/phosphite/phosphonate ABC transporter substrate-binding protein [Dehalococcoidia bacterium]|nr:phosphate/phosphite/phosphonate ABC transporter substrate-binding protein [Dehalococcoidia bacterium]
MKKLLSMVALSIVAFALVLGIACGDDAGDDPPAAANDPKADWPKTLRVGLFGGDDAEETLRNADPMKKLLQEKLGIQIEVFTGTSYGAVIEAMRAKRVDAMLVGPFAYILAVQEAQAEALAVSISTTAKEAVYDSSILPYYMSVVFTKKGNGINSLNDIRGKGFNFVDPASTSGHLAPKTLLIKKGFNPDKDMQTVFAGSHPTSVLSVWNDKAPAGATHEGNLQRLVDANQIKWCGYPDGKVNKPRTQAEIDAVIASCPNGNIVVLAQTDPIPNTPFAVRQDLPKTLKAEIKAALLTTKDNPEFIKARKAWYIDPAPELKLATLDQFYNPLRDIAKLLNLNLKELAEGG